MNFLILFPFVVALCGMALALGTEPQAAGTDAPSATPGPLSGGPEIHEDDLAFHRGEIEGAAVERGKRDADWLSEGVELGPEDYERCFDRGGCFLAVSIS